jgi:hypothetical protein
LVQEEKYQGEKACDKKQQQQKQQHNNNNNNNNNNNLQQVKVQKSIYFKITIRSIVPLSEQMAQLLSINPTPSSNHLMFLQWSNQRSKSSLI